MRDGGFGGLTIPWGKIDAASLPLKRLEGLIEDENVKMKLIAKIRMRTPKPVTRRVPWLVRKQLATASSRQRRTKYLVQASRD
jgi:hypothetical protein